MTKTLLALYALKWNPFAQELPSEALFVSPTVEHFCSRIEQHHVRAGGFALITGDSGTGKSVALRLLAERLGRVSDLTVGALTHPQSQLVDFYRELGELFGVPLQPHNRWGGFKALRERWLTHLDHTRLRPRAPHRRGAGEAPGRAQRAPPAGQHPLRLPPAAQRRPRRRWPPARSLAA